VAALAFLGFFAVLLSWSGAMGVLGNRKLEFAPEGIALTSWGTTRNIPWTKVRSISAVGNTGLRMLVVRAFDGAKSFVSFCWNTVPDEIVCQVEAMRQARFGDVAPSDSDGVQTIEQRNARRRLGMGLVVASLPIGAFSWWGVRLLGSAERPPGVSFRWATAPSRVQVLMMIVALGTALFGLIRWLWPTGESARPAIMGTLQEMALMGVTLILQGVTLMMLLWWLAHPT
jgi:hypothetical protein